MAWMIFLALNSAALLMLFDEADSPPVYILPLLVWLESASSNSMRRAALLSARKIIQAIRAIGQLVKNTIGAWPRGLDRRLWSTQGIFREVRHAAAIQRQRIPLWRGKNRDQTVKLNVNIQEVNTMVSHDSPILSKNKVKKQKKNLRVIRLMQTHQRMEALMVLTAWTWENL